MRDIPVPQTVPQGRIPAVLPQKVVFTEQQLQWLDRMFPEPHFNVGENPDMYLQRAARRAVVLEIRQKLAKQEG